MANFSGNLNLMGFKGARVFTNIDSERPQMAFVCIPVPYNDIQLAQDGRYANARVFLAETNDKFRQACIQRRQQSGDDMTNYTPPSHQMEVSFSPEFRHRALQAAKKRLLTEHPEWNEEDENRNTDLRNAMYDAVRCRLGSLYCHQRQQQTPANGQYTPASQPAQPWMIPADQTIEQSAGADTPDDLPF